ncbi:MAG: ABC transporter ATP-binding protein, partial [Gemmatimonadales bacterium]
MLVGESGAGKSTVLRQLAGLDRPDRGRVVVDGAEWCNTETGCFLPAWERSVGHVAQDYALFPHLTAFDNVAFGLRAQGSRTAAIRSKVYAMLAQLGVGGLAGRRPGELSGGQQQRVALARALVLEPRLLLLDEPLSALDLQNRRLVRTELRNLLAALPCVTVYVTHSPLEALAFGDQIAVIERGRITQTGTRDDLLRHPRSPYVAEFMGVNFFQGAIVSRSDGLARVRTSGGTISVVDPGEGGDEVFVAVNPREIALSAEPAAGSAQNSFEGPITELAPEPPFGERVRVALGTEPGLVAEVTRAAVERLGLREGMMVHATFK